VSSAQTLKPSRFTYKHLVLTLPFVYLVHSIDIEQAQKEAAKMPHCPAEIRASNADNVMGRDYFATNKEKIRADLLQHGAVWLRGFDLMKDVQGHRAMYEALELEPCLDPLHSSGLRKFASERDALYEEVRLNSTMLFWNSRDPSLTHTFFLLHLYLILDLLLLSVIGCAGQ
jgi:hypothetical protein